MRTGQRAGQRGVILPACRLVTGRAIRVAHLKLLSAIALSLTSAIVTAGERWEYLGEVQPAIDGPRGRLSVNLDSLRKRSGHFEVWEKTVFEPAPGTVAGDGDGYRLTLWALRCRFGELAKVTEGTPAGFEPRARLLRFYTPLPASAAAAILDAACGEARRLAAERRAGHAPVSRPESRGIPGELAAPPKIGEVDEFGEGEE